MTKTATYRIEQLNDQLFYIRWQGNPSRNESSQFIADLAQLLNQTDKGLYFISDLRKGRITDIIIIQQLSKLTQHNQWFGSVAFSSNLLSEIFAGSYRNMLLSKKDRNMILEQADEAIAFLEHLQVGLTQDIDWQEVINA